MAQKKKSAFSFVLLAILAKSSKLVKLAKLFKVAKPVVLIVSMSISAIAYTFLLGPWLSILFVALLLIHEMGHVAAMKMKNLKTSTPVFIPFLGAAIFAPKFTDRHTEAFVGFGGPLLGTIGAALVFGLWFITPDKDSPMAHVLMVSSFLGVYLNLFNLLPISPLDGGRITQAVGRWFKYIGLIALAICSMLFRQPVILYIWIVVLFDLTLVPLRMRAQLVACCWFAMATLMYLGFGDQPKWVNIIDCVITLPLVIRLVIDSTKKKMPEEPDNRPDLSSKQRREWLLLYMVLITVLVSLLVVQFPLLPQSPK